MSNLTLPEKIFYGLIILMGIVLAIPFIVWIINNTASFVFGVKVFFGIIIAGAILYYLAFHTYLNEAPPRSYNSYRPPQEDRRTWAENITGMSAGRLNANDKRNWAKQLTFGGRRLRTDEVDRFGHVRRPGQHHDRYNHLNNEGKDWVKRKM